MFKGSRRLAWCFLEILTFAVFAVLPVLAAPKEVELTVTRAQGIAWIRADVQGGTLTLRLPDEIRAGDRFSGTVRSEPAGGASEEVAAFVFRVDDRAVGGGDQGPWTAGSEGVVVTLDDASGVERARTVLATVAGGEGAGTAFVALGILTAGDAASVSGPFDGDLANSAVRWQGVRLEPIAESPRQSFVIAPAGPLGAGRLAVRDGNTFAEGPARLVALAISADDLALDRGQKTRLHVEVRGLDDLREGATFELTNDSSDVISLAGGDRQTREIETRDVDKGGTFRVEEKIRARRRGSFQIVARVTAPDVPLTPTSPALVDCRLDSGVFLISGELCSALDAQPPVSVPVPPSATGSGMSSEPFEVSLENPRLRLAGEDELVSALVYLETAAPTGPVEAGGTTSETEARADEHEVTESEVEQARRRETQAGTALSGEVQRGQALREKRKREREAYEEAQQRATALAEIDRQLEALPRVARSEIETLVQRIEDLRGGQAAPPPVDQLDDAVDQAAARAEACHDALAALEAELGRREGERDAIRSEQEAILARLDALHFGDGWIGGHGFHSDGRAYYGYVGGAGATLGYGSPNDAELSRLRRRLRELNRRVRRLPDLDNLRQQIADQRQDCDALEAALERARQARQQRDAYDLALVELEEKCRELRRLLEPLLQYCEEHPNDCLFRDRLERLAATCGSDAATWEMFWSDFEEVLRQKAYRERLLEEEMDRRHGEIEKLDGEISESDRHRAELQEGYDAAHAEHERLKKARKDQLDAAERARLEEAERREQERLDRLFADGPPLPEPQKVDPKQLALGLGYVFQTRQLQALTDPGDCKNRCILALEDVLTESYVQLVKQVANAVWLGTAMAALSPAVGIVAKVVTAARTGLAVFLNQPDMVTLDVLENQSYSYHGTKRGVRVDIDCQINASLAYNPRTGVLMGLIRCNCCGEEEVLFVKYKTDPYGRPEGPVTFEWL